MLGGAALLPIVGFLAGVIVTRRWGGSQAEQPRIRRNRLVWQIFQWLLLALGATVIALVSAAWIFIGLEEGASEFIPGHRFDGVGWGNFLHPVVCGTNRQRSVGRIAGRRE